MIHQTSLNRGLIGVAAGFLSGSLFLAGCAGMYVIPESMAVDLDRDLTFASLHANPEAHVGAVLPLGGVVLSARNLKEGTEIEILQLPLDRYDRPVGPLSNSQGRFLALHPGYLETAALRNGQRITLVGEVTGSEVRTIDEAEYSYPYVNARFVHLWADRRVYRDHPYNDPYPYPYPYWPPYYRGYPYYWYDPWGPPVIIVPDDSPHPKRRFDPSRGSSPPSAPPSSPDKSDRRMR